MFASSAAVAGNTASGTAQIPFAGAPPASSSGSQIQVGNGQTAHALTLGKLESEQETAHGCVQRLLTAIAPLGNSMISAVGYACARTDVFIQSIMLYRLDVNPLHIAVRNGYSNVIVELIKEGANPDAVDQCGRTPLHRAEEEGNLDAISKLIEGRANPDAVDQLGRTPLHRAAEKGNSDVISKLIEGHANPDAVDKWGETPLHRAAEKGNLDAISKLIEGRANPDAVDKFDRTPLHLAADKGDLDAISKLIEGGANPDAVDNLDRTPLHRAAEKGNSDAISKLIEGRANPDAVDQWGRTPLHLAAEEGNSDAISKLIEVSANPDAVDQWGRTPLHLAVRKGNSGAAVILIKHGVNPLSTNVGSGRPHLEGFIGLMQGYSWTPDHVQIGAACDTWIKCMHGTTGDKTFGHAWIGKAVARQLFAGANNINQVLPGDPQGRTLLEFAVDNKWWAFAHELIKAGAKHDQAALSASGLFPPDDADKIALNKVFLEASKYGWFPLMDALLERGADLRATQENGLSAMEIIVQQSPVDFSLLKLVHQRLLAVAERAQTEIGLNSDHPGHFDLALRRAVENQDLRCVEMLLNLGANPEFRFKDDQDPFDRSAVMLAAQGNQGVAAESTTLKIFQLVTGS